MKVLYELVCPITCGGHKKYCGQCVRYIRRTSGRNKKQVLCVMRSRLSISVSGHQLPTDDGSLWAVLLQAVFLRPTTGLRPLSGCQQSRLVQWTPLKYATRNFHTHEPILTIFGLCIVTEVSNQKILHRVSKNRTRLLCLIILPKLEHYQ